MLTSSRIIELPTEILLAIFNNLSSCKHRPKENDICKCWCLDLMAAATVCSSWYSILFKNTIPSQETYHCSTRKGKLLGRWPEIVINDMGPDRTYPYLKRMSSILKDSKKYNLDLHRQVQYLVVDFTMIDSSRQQHQNKLNFNDVHYKNYIDFIIQLLKTCPHINRLGIMYDTKFISLVTQGATLSESIQQLSNYVGHQKGNITNIKQLDLIGYSPVQRCPCCAGKEWDYLLVPLIDALPLERLVLRHVVPTAAICEALTRQASLIRLTLFRSIMTIPSNDKDQLPISQRPTSIERIPDKVWKQIKHLYIFEESEDSSIWPTRYLDKIADRIETLEQFSLVFGTLKENSQHLEDERNMFLDKRTVLPENNKFGTALIRLISASSDSLNQILLVNVPSIESGRIWF